MYQATVSTTIFDMADIFAIGMNQTSAFFEKYPAAKADPDAVIVAFVQDADLPPCFKDKNDKGKLEYSPRGFEAACSKGKISVERGNNDRLVCVWRDLTLDYNLMVFLAKVYNAARKNAENAQPKEKGERKETKAGKELRERAEAAEAACKAKDAAYLELMEKAEAQDKANKAFTERVRRLVHQLTDASQAAPGQEAAYEAACLALLNLLP